MKQKLIERLSTFLNKHKMRGTPATDEQIEQAEKVLNVKFSSDYIDFIKHFGRAWADIEIFAFEGNETVVGYTQSLREVHAETSENYAVADDGAGNPIMINPKGEVLIFYHDNGENEILASSLEVFIKENFEEW